MHVLALDEETKFDYCSLEQTNMFIVLVWLGHVHSQ